VEWEPWLLFFLRAIWAQIERLREGLAEVPEIPAPAELSPAGLSPLAGRLLALLDRRGTLAIAEAAEALAANRNTLKSKFGELVDGGFAELHGKGRGAHYRPVRR